jgi:ABC-type siderophore export system fused ATPase/permease subunit
MESSREFYDALVDIPGKEGEIPEEGSPISSEEEESSKECVSSIFRDDKL